MGIAMRLAVAALSWLVALAPASAATEAGAPIEVSARVEPDRSEIGTAFRYFVRVESSDDAEIVMPLLVDRIGEFLIRDFGSSAPGESEDGKRVHEQWYDLVGYSTGHQLVKGGVVGYRVAGGGVEQVDVPEAVVTIVSLLPDEEALATADIKEIVGPVGVPRDRRSLYGGLAALALLVGVLALLARRLWSRRQDSAVPQRPAHELALEALTHLRRARLLEEGRQPEFYVRLSRIVREYIEGRFHVRAPEMTTEEFLQVAQSSSELEAQHRARLGEFLSEADLVKFARHVPTVEQGEKAYEAAREFVSTTAPRLEAHDAAA